MKQNASGGEAPLWRPGSSGRRLHRNSPSLHRRRCERRCRCQGRRRRLEGRRRRHGRVDLRLLGRRGGPGGWRGRRRGAPQAPAVALRHRRRYRCCGCCSSCCCCHRRSLRLRRGRQRQRFQGRAPPRRVHLRSRRRTQEVRSGRRRSPSSGGLLRLCGGGRPLCRRGRGSSGGQRSKRPNPRPAHRDGAGPPPVCGAP